jgi:SH3-like domain-containing protein
VVRPPARPDARAPGATTRQGQPGQRGRAAAGAAAGAAGAAGAAAAANRTPEPTPAPPPPPADPQPSIGSVTNLPLPRFAALRSDEVNLRAGPGTRFPIEWTYQRRELPVEITREFELWRRIRDPEGTEGWVHQSTLMGRRSAIVRGAPTSETALRRRPEADSPPVARLRPGVVVRLRQCEPRNPWCEAQAGEYRGYILRSEVWGVNADEEVK